MQILKTLSLTVLLSLAAMPPGMYAQINSQTTKFTETPARTIIIKHPAANDPATYFAMTTVFTFEVYKPGNIDKIVSQMSKDPGVEMCKVGGVNNEYYQINLVVKSAKDKMWFAALFKKAGLFTIKINNNSPVDIDKM